MKALSIDFETRSTVDLRYAGVYRYAEDPSTDVHCMAYCLWDDTGKEAPLPYTEAASPHAAPVQLWLPGDPIPDELTYALAYDFELRAWNAQFERVVWQVMARRYGFPELTDRRELWYCTEAEAYAMNLPGSLDLAAKVLNCREKKDEEGHRVMLQLCKPRQPRKAQGETKAGGPYWWTKAEAPEKYAKLYEYCPQDVRVEMEIGAKINRLSPAERHVYLLDQEINDRGVMLDLDLVRSLKDLSDEAMARANAELAKVTGGEVTKVSQAARIREWVNESLADDDQLEDLTKGTVQDALGGELPDDARRALELRAEAGKASIKKLDSMLTCVCADGRARGLLQYHAAGTGRWGGRLIQPQNMARPTVDDPERFIPRVLRRDYDGIEAEAPVMEVAVSLLRSCFIAEPGSRFLAADYSSIEGHVVAWLAGQDEMMSYYEMGALTKNRVEGRTDVTPEDIEKGSLYYMVGKVAVLACGFGMGGERYVGTVKDWTGLEIEQELGDAVVYEIWRPVNPEIVNTWYELENAATRAVRYPGEIVPAGRGGCLKYVVRGDFLWCVLPSGRPLAYALPKLELDAQGREKLTCSSPNVFYRKADGTWGKKRWGRRSLYGGLLVENAVQALAREIMVGGMIRASRAGYPIVLTVHDEIVAEVPTTVGDLPTFEHCLTQKTRWAQTVPVSVGGWEGQRYRKA